ncbi:hypothetical protein [Corynebacterium pygosceleis]|uniref:Uncharacterized protein n=1 Tax=Corynebacterium pygosceleis TaxID=2800406 RepID=A0ABT3WR01_9CORY|nr:hypothetical protein [Corynebacterium pygosceleis]MCK7675120.1 hypothetical protein [Corynebacterium pygosceleis]MCL0120678.1 hypothetical protein [Corynebacterium pygosceleis]MCX7444218.1 hypothetical protein [Corynebacterium pygosceleis]
MSGGGETGAPVGDEDRAGLFVEEPSGHWIWADGYLRDGHGDIIAMMSAGVIHTEDDNILIERSAPGLRFRCRATLSGGEVYTVVQQGLTVRRLTAYCAGTHYTLRRRSLFGVDRDIIGPGGVIASTHPDLRGALEVHDGPRHTDLTMLEGIVLSWACVLVDAVEHNLRV